MRFRQFQNIWIKKSLHDLTKKINIKNKNKECKNVICNSAQLGLIRQIDFFDKEIAQDGSIENYTIIKKNDFVYNPRKSLNAPYGPVNIYNYEEAGIVSPLYLCFSVHDIDKIFLHYYFKSQAWYRFIYLNGDSGARHDRVSIKDEVFFSQNLYLPNAIEEEKIGVFLTLIDQRIDTQNKIIEDLQTLKISICDKLFEDTTYPEYKLKDVLSERIEKSNVNNQYEILSSTIKGLFTQKEYFDKDIASSNNIGYKIVHLYDIIISPQNLWMGNITFNQRFTNGLVSPSYKIYIINNNFDMYYIANMLKTKRAMYKYICSSQQGASVVRRNLNMDDFLSLSFSIPDINKQRKIGLLLNTIDKRIDLEQTYLTKLNQQKKFLLKNMFI